MKTLREMMDIIESAQDVEEARAISKPENGIVALKKFTSYLKRNIVDLASMADFEADHSKQPYVDDRFNGFLTRADGTPVTPIFNMGGKLALVGPNKNYLNIPTGMYYQYQGLMYGGVIEQKIMEILGYKQQGVKEGEVVPFRRPVSQPQVSKDVLHLANEWFHANDDTNTLQAVTDPEYGQGAENLVKYIQAKLQSKGWTIDFDDEIENIVLTNRSGQKVALSVNDAYDETGWAQGMTEEQLEETSDDAIARIIELSK